MKKISFDELFEFLPKSKRQARVGLPYGLYPFYTSSNELKKFFNEFDYSGNCLIFGTGGSPSVHYQAGKFSTSTDCIVSCPKNISEVNAKYIYLFFRSNMNILEAGFKGAGLKHISKGYISNIKIPLPSLDDQIRITTVLTRVEKLVAKRKESIKALDELLKSTFVVMFGLNSTDYNQWEMESLKTNTEIVSGVTKGKKYKFSNLREVPYMRVANVQDGHLDLTEIKTIEVTGDEIQHYKLIKGDLLLTEGGDPDKLGRGAVWNDEIDECIHQNHIFRVRIKDTSINPIFLSALIASKYGKSFFLKAAKQTTGIASINSTQLKAFPLMKPPILLQNKFATIVEKVEALKARYTQSLNELENLYGSLSQRAFKGELDLSKVLVETENEIIELQEEGISSVDSKLTESKIYSEAELSKIIQSLAGEPFSFDSLMTELEKANFEEMPEYEELKEQVYKMLERPTPVLSQTLDEVKNKSGKVEKKIVLRVNI